MSEPQTNGYDQKRTSGVIETIEGLKAEQRRIKAEAAAKIAPKLAELSQEIGAKMKEAKKAWGIPTHILKAQLKIRDFDRRKNESIDALDDDDQGELTRMREGLGDLADLPLGAVLLAGKPTAGEPTATETKRRARRAAANDAMDSVGREPGEGSRLN